MSKYMKEYPKQLQALEVCDVHLRTYYAFLEYFPFSSESKIYK